MTTSKSGISSDGSAEAGATGISQFNSVLTVTTDLNLVTCKAALRHLPQCANLSQPMT